MILNPPEQLKVPTHYKGLEIAKIVSAAVIASGDAKRACKIGKRIETQGTEDKTTAMRCGSGNTKCVEMDCEPFGLSDEDSSATLSLAIEFVHTNLSTLRSVGLLQVGGGGIVYETSLHASLPRITRNNVHPDKDTCVTTVSLKTDKPLLAGIKIWQLILAIVGALLLLLFVILLLVYLQCFKRRTPPQKEQLEQAELLKESGQGPLMADEAAASL